MLVQVRLANITMPVVTGARCRTRDVEIICFNNRAVRLQAWCCSDLATFLDKKERPLVRGREEIEGTVERAPGARVGEQTEEVVEEGIEEISRSGRVVVEFRQCTESITILRRYFVVWLNLNSKAYP